MNYLKPSSEILFITKFFVYIKLILLYGFNENCTFFLDNSSLILISFIHLLGSFIRTPYYLLPQWKFSHVLAFYIHFTNQLLIKRNSAIPDAINQLKMLE